MGVMVVQIERHIFYSAMICAGNVQTFNALCTKILGCVFCISAKLWINCVEKLNNQLNRNIELQNF